ncbi:hypothetical protein EDC90_1003184 [Martelella mediterranea]|uniref:Entericidin B n=1 Tax=Martelella mediterranea TaxID=293089 RepID=A0A4R3P4K3_9HYPH|nr:hypothetical protein EDC90_1003184 [Martelella mediterranea]
MLKRKLLAIIFMFGLGAAVTSCGNTIEGMGQDTANAIDATQDAGRSIDNAAQ